MMKLKTVESFFTIIVLLCLSIIVKSEVYIVTIEGEPVISYKGGVNGFEATEKLDVNRNSWHKLGAMPTEDAMHKYLEIITELYPNWADGLKSKTRNVDSNEQPSNDSSPVGPVFSTLMHDVSGNGNELKLDAIHDYARKGDIKNLLKCVESGVSVDTKDSEGRTPLHWASGHGHIDVVQLLLYKNADVNSKDNEGNTALNYAAAHGTGEIIELLVKGPGGSAAIKVDDLNT